MTDFSETGEHSHIDSWYAPADEAPRPGALPLILLFESVGLLLVALSNRAGLAGDAWGGAAYWAGLLTMLVPATYRLLSRDASRLERYGIILGLGLAMFAVKMFASPTMFALHDELGHYRTTADILGTGHLFHVNPIVQYYPYYPGLPLATAALASIGALSIHTAGVLVSLAARVILLLFILLTFEAMGQYPRLAGIACLIYLANPNFVYFDAMFSSETLALALMALILFVVIRRQSSPSRVWPGDAIVSTLAIAALVVSGHLASLILSAFLLLWVVATAIVRPTNQDDAHNPRGPLGLALLSTVLAVGWLVRVASLAVVQLSPLVDSAIRAVTLLLTDNSRPKVLFESGQHTLEPILSRLLGFGSVAVALLALAFGLWHIWTRQRGRGLALSLGVVGLLYPVALVMRFTSQGTEISNRSNEYVFFAIGYLGACFVTDFLLSRPWGRFRQQLTNGALILGAVVLVLGGIIVGWPAYARRAGPYLVGADSRSVGREGIAVARWASGHLPKYQGILADETNGLLLGAIAKEDPRGGSVDGVSVWQVYFTNTFGAVDRNILSGADVHYVVTDRRLTRSLPYNSRYFGRSEPNEGHHLTPLSPQALAKFGNVPGADRIFDTPDISIYDMAGINGGR